MVWLVLSIISYFLNAVVAIGDKFLLHQKIRSPLVYTFYVAVLNLLAFLLWPLDFSFIPPVLALTAFSAGITFLTALFFFYSALKKGEVSRIVSIVGAVSPLTIFALSYVFLGERLPVFWFLSFIVLVCGTVLFLFEKAGKGEGFLGLKTGAAAPLYSFVAAIFFALTFFLSKAVFLKTSFINGFIWTRVSIVVFALLMYLFPFFRKLIHKGHFSVEKGSFLLFLSNKSLGALAFIILNYAIALGSVSIVNALQGVQYVFLFFLTIIFSVFSPGILSESLRTGTIVQKSVGIILISLGIIILFIV